MKKKETEKATKVDKTGGTPVEIERGVSLLSEECKVCPTPHHNYWICGACNKRLGETLKPTMHRNEAYKHCPNCGVKIAN